MFQLNASVVIRAKVKNSTKTPHFIVRYWGTCQWMSMDVIGVQMSERTGCSPVYHHILWHYFTTPLFGSHSISSAQAQKNSPQHSVRACTAAILLVWSKLHKLSWFIYYHMWCIWLDNKTSPKECNLRISVSHL